MLVDLMLSSLSKYHQCYSVLVSWQLTPLTLWQTQLFTRQSKLGGCLFLLCKLFTWVPCLQFIMITLVSHVLLQILSFIHSRCCNGISFCESIQQKLDCVPRTFTMDQLLGWALNSLSWRQISVATNQDGVTLMKHHLGHIRKDNQVVKEDMQKSYWLKEMK